MTPKQYLMQYKRILAQIRIIETELAAIEDEIGITAGGDGIHGTEISNTTERLALRLVEIERKLYVKREAAWAKREEIENAILMVERSEYSRLLYDRYICCRSWSDVALGLGCSVNYCKSRLHSAALQAVTKWIPKEDRENEMPLL